MTERIDYFLSLNSPWVHLGAARLMAMVDRHGASLRVHPVDFGAIFPASGGLPLPKRAPQRQAYRLQELARWRDFLGVPLNLRPRHAPAPEAMTAQSVLVVRETMGDRPAATLAHRILKALWEEEADPGDQATLARLITELGLDAPAILAAAEEPGWAELRTSETAQAVARGVFGAPTYLVGTDMFWGQDRLDFLERRLMQAPPA